ncbi:MAG: CPBP family intramembrane metalloprotease [Nocardioides sp.]|nr:CPBP family intramembrane metalloprotease [Nocardioides sp.]
MTWRLVAALEVMVAAGLILVDVGIPTVAVLLIAALSLTVRREGLSSLGLVRLRRPGHTFVMVLALTLGWTAFQFGLTMPVLNRVTGERQDMGTFADLEGDLGLLVLLLVVSWVLAAFGEELVYRGYVPVRAAQVLGGGRPAVVIAFLGAAGLFALAHSEQGQVGVALTFLDALFFSVLRFRCGGLWASVLGHGLSNTIGLTTFFLVGPVYGLW